MIGDVLTTSILFEALKEKYPNSELHFVINTHTFAVVEHNPFIDKFVFITPEIESSKGNFFKFLKSIKKEKYDAVIDVYGKLSSNLMTYFSGANIKVSEKKWYTKWLYTHTYSNYNAPKTVAGLAIENRLQMLQPFKVDESKIYKPKIFLTKDEISEAKSYLESNGIQLLKPLYMISVLGSGESKTYPFNYMAKVLDAIAETKKDAQILFNYIPKQKAEAKAVYDLCKKETQDHIYFDVFGGSLREFLAITSHCNALIGNEGGAVNMAKGLNIPTFTIFSPWIKKESWNMFEDGKQNVSVHLNDFQPEHYANIEHPKELKNKALELYQNFKPELFIDKLKNYLV